MHLCCEKNLSTYDLNLVALLPGEHKSNLYDYPLHGIKANLCWLAPEILKQVT